MRNWRPPARALVAVRALSLCRCTGHSSMRDLRWCRQTRIRERRARRRLGYLGLPGRRAGRQDFTRRPVLGAVSGKYPQPALAVARSGTARRGCLSPVQDRRVSAARGTITILAWLDRGRDAFHPPSVGEAEIPAVSGETIGGGLPASVDCPGGRTRPRRRPRRAIFPAVGHGCCAS